MSDLKVGDKAPDFSVVNDVNETVNLKDLAGQKVILYFYPKDNTPGCSIEAQQFNEAYKNCKMPVMLFWVSVATR